jgi:hypothetical protein
LKRKKDKKFKDRGELTLLKLVPSLTSGTDGNER